MDAALIAVTGISAILQRQHVCLSLAGVSFYSAVTGAEAIYVWRVLRIALVLLSAPLSLRDSESAFSPWLSYLAVGIAVGESASAANVYPFIVLFICVLLDIAAGALRPLRHD